ncbi:hypothetical protein Ahy_B08g092585 [Arachis hypogaea]|uniref:Aminotransferase-like plant mobile domain-containing protein n=1 Tax=Arachis hypogaea TaxID=3818 RepID=A0A444Y4E0_ARAHY|nr:hypothetical protein Ahy_B08g092585 [Arachis hypogaea]
MCLAERHSGTFFMQSIDVLRACDDSRVCVLMRELLGVLPPANCIQKFAMNYSWFQETFGELPDRADEPVVRRYARAYIMMLLGTQLFADKFGNRIHIRWLPYVARLEDMGGPVGYDTFSWPLASSSHDVVQVVHPEILEPRHTELWRSVMALIYFAVVEWHQIDRVLSQFCGVQPRPQAAPDIDFLMSKMAEVVIVGSCTACSFGTFIGRGR